MKVDILDACALTAYLRGEDGAEVVAGILQDTDIQAYCHAVNILEIYYDALRRGSVSDAKQLIAAILTEGVMIRRDIDDEFLFAVGALKQRGRVSLADCFCLALTQKVRATVVTSDHHEFDALVPLDICPILFVR